MTAGQFREVDPDLLADYVGGALAGTPEGMTVARLIAEDPGWERAHADLVRATGAVRFDLAGWGAVPEPMPDDVADRLSAALRSMTGAVQDGSVTGAVEDGSVTVPAPGRSAGGPAPGTGDPAAPEPGARPGRRAAVVVPDQTRPGGARNRGTAPGRRRWSRLAGPVAVAAAVAAFGGFGMSRLISPDATSDSAVTTQRDGSGAESAPDAGGAEGPPRTLAEPPAERLLASGTDYTATGLAASAKDLDQRTGTDDAAPSRAATDFGTEGGRPPPAGLVRLTDRTALAGCLDAVAAEHDGGGLVIDVVDYATFEGAPALIVRFVDAAGERWAVAAGPACGQPGSGADTRYRAQVG